MTARLRSNVIERQEKGLGPFSLKRLLLAGGAAAGLTLLLGRLVGFAASCLSGLFVLSLVLLLTHPVEGMPLLRYAANTLRGLATQAALQGRPGGLLPLAGVLLQVQRDEGRLDGDVLFECSGQERAVTLPGDEWEYVGGFCHTGEAGLSSVPNPFTGALDEGVLPR